MAPKRRRDDVVAPSDPDDAPGSPARKRVRKSSGRESKKAAENPAPPTITALSSRRNTKDQPSDMNIDPAPAPSHSCQHEDLTLVIRAAESFVKAELANNDSSHDFFHICRVRAVAESMALQEGLSESQRQVVTLSALLHDVGDWKYAKGNKAQGKAVENFLKSQGVSRKITAQVTQIINSVGFKEELQASRSTLSLESKIVQDADRLDAIGAIGIARCLTFGGAKNRVLHDPAIPPRLDLTKEEYMAGAEKATTINHFHEKLLKLKGLMKTDTGRAMAEKRHSYMEGFLKEFEDEWQGFT